jgi:hypothetical protein
VREAGVDAARTRPWPASERLLTRAWRSDAAALTLLTGVIAIVYVLVDAPLYNPPGIDDWVYTGLFMNFHFIYDLFWNTYYASRLPWVVPGFALHHFLPDHAAYFVLHGAFFFGGAIAAFALVRRFLGRLAAVVAYVLLIGNQLYYNANAWNYVDGAVVTYLLVAFACGVTLATGARRVASMFTSGFFLAAGVATNVFVGPLALGLPLLYVAVHRVRGRGRGREIALDVAAVAAGIAVLLVGGGIFASANGGRFWFLGPQLRAVSAIDPRAFRSLTYDWVGRSPRLLVPLLLLLVGAIVLPRARRLDPDCRRLRFAIGAYAYLALAEAYFVAYELAGGAPLEYAFYESLQLPAIALGAAAVVYGLTVAVGGLRRRSLVLALAGLAGTAPLLIIYLPDSDALVGSHGMEITVAVSVLAAVSAAVASRGASALPVAATAAVATLVFGVNFAIASSPDVFVNGESNPRNGDAYNLAGDLIGLLRGNGFQHDTPFFWYDGREAVELTELQSLYFFSYTYLGTSMPTIDDDFRFREQLYKPRTIVLLCIKPSCRGGPAALRRHGYRLAEAARRRLSSGPVGVWVRVFRVTPPSPGG